MTCKYFSAGHCEYGSRCRYDHVKPKSAPKPSTESNRTRIRNIRKEVAEMDKQKTMDFSNQENRHENSKPCSSNGQSKLSSAWSKPLKFSVDAPVFVPRQLLPSEVQLCPYFEVSGECVKGDLCALVHGDLCEMCGQFVLHPYNEDSRRTHHRECLSDHEKAMKDAFLNQVSAEKQCGVCMENIVAIGARFGILQNCKHCYCLKCIREWRKKEEFEKKVVRSCPECRVRSDFIIPSSVWVEDQQEKDEIIAVYQQNMSQKVCKYMAKGVAEDCPFGNKCFYKHQLPDGSVVAGKSPKELRSRLNHRYNLSEAFEFIASMDLIQAALMEDLWTDDSTDED
ncbi:unnamed protein product [Bursaphelenchus xylophilus]|uniref:RING-type E3 ubiquitin transferase n=1 Tax=Bursaphelenchus xylophilus TaxID=6326 RepID=A0A1I7S3K8_BURXY|nr:unnamed protein product [Bursaphelenchus xylophilus]CAG9116380.1 unnamed protein product [Bursaphelenchus xylophilus]